MSKELIKWLGIAFLVGHCSAYYPDMKEHYISDSLLRDLFDVVGKDFIDEPVDEYVDPLPMNNARLAMMARATKDLEAERLMDYDSMMERANPSLRDQEYMQHSSLWGHQFVTGGAGEGKNNKILIIMKSNKISYFQDLE